MDTLVNDFGTFFGGHHSCVNCILDIAQDCFDLFGCLTRLLSQVADFNSNNTKTFAVFTGSELPAGDRPPVAGSWTIDGDLLRFTPRYPLVPGLAYVARLDLRALSRAALPGAGPPGEPLVASFSLPRVAAEPSTVVRQVYPTAAVLPENLLRLYVELSAPMSRGEAYDHVRLLDAAGDEVDGAFLEIREELWDPGMRRLTLLFDPGRIKRGLRPHLEARPPLRLGASYRLVIDPGWRDGQGLPLVRGFEKAFTVTAADRRSPDPADWELTAPAAGGRGALELRFPEPLDHGLLSRVVRVRDSRGGRVAGRVEVSDGERNWRFTPRASWRAGVYAVEIETLLEDLAGNNLNRVFDVATGATPAPAAGERDTVSLPFTVGTP